MTCMRKSVREPAIPSISIAPSVQDRIQEVAPAFEASSKDVVNHSIDPALIQPQPDVNPPRLEKEIRCPEIPTSNPMDQEVLSLSHNRVDAKVLEEMRDKMVAAIAEAQHFKDQVFNLESEL
ncbi:hypothetical protein Nepgr_015928 [Nepenthes gracilis]|uniref:Uncharacterized protein n=1 Tax=Nepenthes gracilis TaxID=150966 RepID=A0AAD3SP45_NEPGR|nr:hypothetical protein Nepgr_015928 [Nepenthes gracilis]